MKLSHWIALGIAVCTFALVALNLNRCQRPGPVSGTEPDPAWVARLRRQAIAADSSRIVAVSRGLTKKYSDSLAYQKGVVAVLEARYHQALSSLAAHRDTGVRVITRVDTLMIPQPIAPTTSTALIDAQHLLIQVQEDYIAILERQRDSLAGRLATERFDLQAKGDSLRREVGVRDGRIAELEEKLSGVERKLRRTRWLAVALGLGNLGQGYNSLRK